MSPPTFATLYYTPKYMKRQVNLFFLLCNKNKDILDCLLLVIWVRLNANRPGG